MAQDGRLGSFDAETTAGAPGRASLAGRRGRGARARRAATRRSTAPRCWARCAAPSSGWSTSSPTSATRPSGSSHLFQGLYALLAPARARSRPAGPRPCWPGWRRSPAFSSPRAATIDEPPSVFVDTALSMLGGGGQLIAEVVAVFAGAAPDLADQLKTAGQAALQALVAFGAALRDEIEPSPDPHAFAIGEEQFSRRLHHEHALDGGPSELWRYGLHLQEEVTEEIVAAGGAARPPSLARAGRRAPGRDAPADELLGAYRRELDRRAQLRDRATIWWAVPEAAVEVVPDAGVPRRAGAVRGVRAAADLPGRSHRPLLRHRAGSVSAARSIRPAAAGPLPPCHPGHGGARGLSGPSPPAGHGPGARLRGAAPHLDSGHGRRLGPLLRAAHGARRATIAPTRRGSFSW